MSRLVALAAFASLLAGPQDSLEKLAGKARAELQAQRPLEAAAILDEIDRRDPRWPGLRELTLDTASWLKIEDRQMRQRGLELLRRLQRNFPDSGDHRFRETVTSLVGHSFVTFPTVSRPDPKAQLTFSKTTYANNGDEARPRSTFTVFRLKDEAVRKSLERFLAEPDQENLPALDVPRESWERIGQAGYEGEDRPAFDLSRPGVHVIEEELAGLRAVNFVTVSRFDLLVKRAGESLLAWAVDLETGQPVAGVTVRVRCKDAVRELKTGDDGLARLEAPLVEGVVGILGPEVHYMAAGFTDSVDEPHARVYLTTDRPLYRPGQTVRFKAVRRNVAKGRLRLPDRERIRVVVNDPEGRQVHEEESEWNAEGSLSGSFRIGDEPPLGDYSIVIAVPTPNVPQEPPSWKRTFTVAEYRKPEMQVRIEFPDGLPVIGGRVKARIRAEYYFGGPVANAQVCWKAVRRGDNPFAARPRPWRDEPRMDFYRMDDRDEVRDDDGGFAFNEASGRGEGTTGADGTMDVEFVAERPEGHRSGSLTFRIGAEVTDLSRYSANSLATIEIDSSDFRIRMSAASGYAAVGGRMQARIRLQDREGRPAADQEVELSAFTAPESGDKEVEFESIFKGTASTDRDGSASFSFTPDQPGRLRLRARARDAQGRLAEDRADLSIAGEPAEDSIDHVISVVPERPVVVPGEVARFLVKLPRKRLTALLTLEGSGIHGARVVQFRNRTEILEVPVLDAHAPNVFVKLVAWKDGASMSGGHEIGVLPSASFIDVDVRAERDRWQPRERGKVTVTTRIGGKPVAAEVELGIVDEPVFSLRPDRSPDIRRFFLRPREDDTLSIASTPFHYLCESFTGRGGGPLTGVLVAAVGDEASQDVSVRRNFPDTMLWLGHVRTGDDGKAEVDVEMPDSLTTWRLTARATSGPDRFGSALSRTLCRKDILVRLAAPRFFTERDRAMVAGIVHNDRHEDLEFRVTLEADLLEVEGGEKTIKVPAGGAARVEWPVKASTAGAARLRLIARSAGGSDAMEVALPVHPHGVETLAVRTGALKGRWEAVLDVPPAAIPGTIVLDVSARAAGLSAVLDALPGLAGYPYGCVEQTMSRFLPSVVAAGALRRLGVSRPSLETELPRMVDAGLRRLYDFQHQDGGWGWWKDDDTHPFMTAYVVHGLLTAKTAGVDIRRGALEKGLDWLAQHGRTAFAASVLQAGGRPQDLEGFAAETDEDRAWLAIAGRKEAARGLGEKLPESASGETIRGAALILRAVASIDRKDPRVDRLVEWIMLQRRGDSWISTLDTAHVVYALSELASAERGSAIRVRLNGADAPLENGRLRRTNLPPGRVAVVVEGTPESLTFCSAALRFRTREDEIREARGDLQVERRFERVVRKGDAEVVEVLDDRSTVKAGDELRVVVVLRPKAPQQYVMVECPLPAGAEPREDGPGNWDAGNRHWYARREVRDDRVCVAALHLEEPREFTFRIRPTMPGVFHVMPARAFAMYDPDRRGSSAEFLLRVAQ